MAKKRPKISEEIKAELLFSCRNTCPLCSNQGLPMQIHHIDENPENNDLDNLIPLCLTCHSKVHLKSQMGTIYTPALLKKYRDDKIKFYNDINEKVKQIFIAKYSGETNGH